MDPKFDEQWFRDLIGPYFIDMDPNDQINILRKIKLDYVPSCISDIKENLFWCSKCGRYVEIPKEGLKETISEEIRKGIIIVPDCGYGDDDIIGDEVSAVVYRICPVCGGREKKEKHILRIENERSRT